MASKSRTTAACHDQDEQVVEKTKEKKKKEKNCPSEKVDKTMGCAPSQAVVIHSPERTRQLQPTIFMVADENFRMLRELGELKFYQLANYNDTEHTEYLHRDFASRLENPVLYGKDQVQKTVTISSAVQTEQTRTSEEILCHNTHKPDLDQCAAQDSNFNTIPTQGKGSKLPCSPRCAPRITSSSSDDESSTKFGKKTSDITRRKTVEKDNTSLASSLETISILETSETTTKSKNFFRRNRVQPKYDADDTTSKQTTIALDRTIEQNEVNDKKM